MIWGTSVLIFKMAVVSDIKKALNPQWRHSNRVYAILEYNYIVFPITLALVFYCTHMFPITRLMSGSLTYFMQLTENSSMPSATGSRCPTMAGTVQQSSILFYMEPSFSYRCRHLGILSACAYLSDQTSMPTALRYDV